MKNLFYRKLNGMAWLKEKASFKLKAIAGIALMLIAFFTISAFTNDAGTGAMIAPFIGLAAIKRDPNAGGSSLDEKKQLLNDIQDMIDKGTKDAATKTELEALKTKLENSVSKEELKAVSDEAIRLAGIVKAMGENGGKQADMSIKGQVAAWVTANKTILEAIKSGQKHDLPSLTIKVASPMTPANTLNSSAYLPQPEFEAGINDIVRVKPTFWDYLKKGRTNSAAYVWVNKKNPLGAAAFIAPGVLKPGVSFEIATEISNAKKIAVSEKMATELLQDIDGFTSWVENELAYQLKQKLNSTLMTGTLSSTVPAGIQTISDTFSLTTVKTTNPNHWDAIRACVAQLRSQNFEGVITAFVNPIDKANMDLTKAQSQGQLFIPADAGAVIVEDNNIPVGYVQVAILDLFKVLIYQDFMMAFGWENDDFTKNLVTAIAEMRIHSFHSENNDGAFIYDTFANIETAITLS